MGIKSVSTHFFSAPPTAAMGMYVGSRPTFDGLVPVLERMSVSSARQPVSVQPLRPSITNRAPSALKVLSRAVVDTPPPSPSRASTNAKSTLVIPIPSPSAPPSPAVAAALEIINPKNPPVDNVKILEAREEIRKAMSRYYSAARPGGPDTPLLPREQRRRLPEYNDWITIVRALYTEEEIREMRGF